MIEKLKYFDTKLFFYINGKHNSFFDEIMYLASDKWFWVPFYFILLLLLLKFFKKKTIVLIPIIALTITLCDQMASHLIKNIFLRLRPSHEPDLIPYIHLSKAGAGGMYGFVSSHSANVWGLTTFLLFLLPTKYNWLKAVMIFWAILVSYSRIYNSVHYPLDVLGGMTVGITMGSLVYYGSQKLNLI